jgi:hypothetical protein
MPRRTLSIVGPVEQERVELRTFDEVPADYHDLSEEEQRSAALAIADALIAQLHPAE